ncbi:hydroxymethylbilane synthase [Asticcacaulis sp. EMRT-3]|uniref:hydroxymethylbilane synthase n=1 Tax=Asticcacaulis sp. EMRT-3 TaxID=3040349 RepID=UPI0024AFA3A1|nr:hydroxymethylbilane synthase [Asticcacaulis sp. EMRT-3]MDI7776158.1 hydroxymethylbilane synthase [Asticcacaulis sp. EMRT-3]
MTARLKIGTRGSKLALTQCGWVQRRIVAALNEDPSRADEIAPLTIISTAGDRIQDRRLIEAGGKQLFTKEIEDALLRGEIDVAVHSLKDMPADDIPGLSLCAVPEREDARDAFLSPNYVSMSELPQGARLGTASMRRQAQALSRRPDLQIVMMRGNVDTRLAKLQAGECDALLLAAAGLNRLGLDSHIRSFIDPDIYASAPGQGALAIQCRSEDAGADWMKKLHHEPTFICVRAERGALEALEASCRTAVGAYARLDGTSLHLFVEALSADGKKRWQRRATLAAAHAQSAHALGRKLGEEIRAEAGPDLILAVG